MGKPSGSILAYMGKIFKSELDTAETQLQIVSVDLLIGCWYVFKCDGVCRSSVLNYNLSLVVFFNWF